MDNQGLREPLVLLLQPFHSLGERKGLGGGLMDPFLDRG